MTPEAAEILSGLSIEQKASLCSGLDYWHLKPIEKAGLASIMMTDGPHGLRKQTGESDHAGLNESLPATCFPAACALASSWDRKLLEETGRAIAEECLDQEVSVVLGPGANIKRNPLCGRNFEYYSEDPYLTGELAAAQINGTQKLGVGCSLKHYAVNNQEAMRMTIDTLVDERTLRELYLTGFEKAVKQSQPWTVMCSYNSINGEFAAENRHLLSEILKEEWKHSGLVITDWGACNDRVAGIVAGQEIEMPGSTGENDASIAEAVKTGKIPLQLLDERAGRIIDLILKSMKTLSENRKPADYDAHHRLARETAARTIVLLKNMNSVLPLSGDEKIALIGEFAEKPRYQGAGSSRINPVKLDRFLDILRQEYPRLEYARGYDTESDLPDDGLIADAVEKAKNADNVIILAGLTDSYESESFDRSHLSMPESHNRLIEAVSEVNSGCIVCLSNGAPVLMPWIENVAAVVECYLGGQAGAGALADILSGRVNPSGRLAESFPAALEDLPSTAFFPGGPRQVEYREGPYIGYRFHDASGCAPLFPFGFGLSYTTFDYSDMETSSPVFRPGDSLKVRLKVSNTGSRTGTETVQLYIAPPETGIFRPVKELKGFAKCTVEPGKHAYVEINLDDRSFSRYSPENEGWIIDGGEYRILAGASSEDIRLSCTVNAEPQTAVTSLGKDSTPGPDSWYAKPLKGTLPSEKDWRILYGREIPANVLPDGYNRNTMLKDFGKTFVGKIILNAARKDAEKQGHGNENSAGMYEAMVNEMPLRALANLGEGRITFRMVDAMLYSAEKPVRGFFRLLAAAAASIFGKK